MIHHTAKSRAMEEFKQIGDERKSTRQIAEEHYEQTAKAHFERQDVLRRTAGEK